MSDEVETDLVDVITQQGELIDKMVVQLDVVGAAMTKATELMESLMPSDDVVKNLKFLVYGKIEALKKEKESPVNTKRINEYTDCAMWLDRFREGEP